MHNVRSKNAPPAAFLQFTMPSLGKLTLAKAAFLYMLGGTLGTLWEVIFNVFFQLANHYTVQFIYCSGSIFTTFNPVYGLGTLVIVLFLRNFRKPWQVFLCGAFLGGLVEILLSLLEESLFGTRSWNYTTWPMSIAGRTTVPIMILWGALCMAVIFAFWKPADRFFETLPQKTLQVLGWCALALILFDLALTCAAIVRYVERDSPPLTAFGEWLDKTFPDSFMRKHFPSMKIKK